MGSETTLIRRGRQVRVADEHLVRVLAGEDFLLLDGAMGTQLQQLGASAGEPPELLCLTDPDLVTQVHRRYVEAGSEMVMANTFGANRLKLEGRASVEEVYAAAIGCARASGARYVAADLGPTGALLRPLGTLSFDEAYELYAEQVRAAAACGADAFVIETLSDLAEMKAAVLACREQADLPIFATMTFGEDGRAVYDISAEEFCAPMRRMLELGVTVIGACCGSGPSIIAGERRLLDAVGAPRPRVAGVTAPDPGALVVCSAQELVEVGHAQVAVIGERINPTGKRRLKEALRSGDHDYVLGEAIAQVRAGAQILDVNAGLPEIDERAVLTRLVEELQGVVTCPVQIDSSDAAAVEAAVRSYPGKPIINSVNGSPESIAAVLPIAARYGCAVVGLALDEAGIPSSAQGRVEIAARIVGAAEALGMARADVVVDCLAMAVSTDQSAGSQILQAMRRVRQELGVHCTLGVSNISFGLPARDLLNATFLAAALEAGLDVPIMNPLSRRCMDAVRAWRVLSGQDEGAARFIADYAGREEAHAPAPPAAPAGVPGGSAAGPVQAGTSAGGGTDVSAVSAPSARAQARECILAGRAAPVERLTRELLGEMGAMGVINEVLIPALDEAGERFERGTFFLPQLMASAEAAKAGFEVIRAASPVAGGEGVPDKGAVALATVKGDIHDIGKNIVKMLLDNYGYHVIDLGRDVDPHVVLKTVQERHIRLVGLSALMTTTVANMAQTIELLHREAPGTLVMVGGAVLTPEYAQQIGADFYAKDAAESARIAARVFG